MPEPQYSIQDGRGNQVTVRLRRDKRLTKSSRWQRLPDGSLLVRIPYRMPKRRISAILEQIAAQLVKSSIRQPQRNDADLHQRAERINQKHFKGKIQWNAIRWVNNMESSLGSCTRGGATDGQIRINSKIKNWPDWVIDYVIAHELTHRIHPNHSASFWNELKVAYPLTERARGFIQGAGFAARLKFDDDEEEPSNL